MPDGGEVAQAETVLHALFPTRLFLLSALRKIMKNVNIEVKTKKPPSTVLPRDYSAALKVWSEWHLHSGDALDESHDTCALNPHITHHSVHYSRCFVWSPNGNEGLAQTNRTEEELANTPFSSFSVSTRA